MPIVNTKTREPRKKKEEEKPKKSPRSVGINDRLELAISNAKKQGVTPPELIQKQGGKKGVIDYPGELASEEKQKILQQAQLEQQQNQIQQNQVLQNQQNTNLNPALAGVLGLEAQKQGLDFEQALASGGKAAALGAPASAAVAAGATALTGGVALPAAPVIIAGGAALSFIGGVVANLQSQASGRIEAASQNVEKVETNLRALVQDTNMNPANAARNMQLFQFQLGRVDSAYSKLQLETRNNLNKFLGKDGTPQLERFEIFNSPGGARELLVSQMQTAVLNPNPNINLITAEDLK